jgi:hypothetical protein
MAHWFMYTGGCTSAQATKLDAVAKSMGMGEDAGLELFARAQACSLGKAGSRMSIARADQSIAWGRGRLTAIRYRRQWAVS